MLCQFCKGGHKSMECDEYVSDKHRKEFAEANKMCLSCFGKSASIHKSLKACKSGESCGAWYSLEHHTVFCPKRVKAQKIFFPKIDEILWRRFVKTLDPDEQFTLVLSALPEHKKYVNLKNISLVETLDVYTYSQMLYPNYTNNHTPLSLDSILIVIHTLIFQGSNENILLKSIMAKTTICKARVVIISYARITSHALLQLVTPYAKEVKMECVPSDVTFAELFKNAPNIEDLKIDDKSLAIDEKTWLKDLLRYKNGKNFRKLNISFKHFVEFDIDKLMEFVTAKCVENVKIKICYKVKEEETEEWKNCQDFVQKLSNNLTEEHLPGKDDGPLLILGFNGTKDFRYFKISKSKNVNKKVMPSRAAKKRCITLGI